MLPTLYDIQLLQQHEQTKYIKIELLDRMNGIVLENIEGELLNDSGSIDNTSNNRRTYNADFRIKDSTFLVDENNKIWLDKYIRVYVGILDIRTKEPIYYILGTFAMSEAGYSYSESESKLSLTLLDKMAFLDGTLGGIVNGALNLTIQSFVNDEYHSAVTIDANKDFTTIKAGTVFTLPIPQHKEGTGTTGVDYTINNLGIKIVPSSDFVISDPENSCIEVDFVEYIEDYGSNDKYNIYNYQQGIEGKIIVNSITKSQIKELKITFLQDIELCAIHLYNDTEHIVDWCFYGNRNTIREDFTNEVQTLGYRTANNPDNITDEVTKGASEPTWIVGKITVNTTEGRKTFLEEVVESGLKAANITEYEIRNIHEVVPYDQEFQVGTNWYDVFSTLIKLYTDIEMFFDEYGVFVIQYYSTIEDKNIVLDNDTLKSLEISTSYSNSFAPVYNVTEVWGQAIESDVYAENTESEPYLVKYSNNNFSVNFTDLYLTDQGKISNGTILAFKTPVDMPQLTSSPTLTVNSIKTAVANVEKIDKVFTCDEFETSNNSKTGYKIDEDGVYAESCGNLILYTEDILFGSETGYKQIPDNGGTNWSNYGVRSANKSYQTSTGAKLEIPNIIGSNSSPVIIDGISFKGTFYNMLNASNMVNVSSASGRHTIDLTIRNYCIYINAIEGEIYRFYYTNMSGSLYAAYASTGVFKTENRPFLDHSAVNGMNYSDFVAPETGGFYIFWYTTNSADISFRLYGVSKITAKQGEYPIVNYTDEQPVDYSIFKANESYCLKYNNEKLYYLGQWQIHAVAIEVLTVPEKDSDEYKKYRDTFNCSNLIFTQLDSKFAVEKIGIKSQSLSGSEYDDIFTDDLALQRAEYENWKAMRIVDNVNLTTIQIPFLDVNVKVTYQLPNKQLKTYVVERISYSNTSETMTIEMNTFYPLYR